MGLRDKIISAVAKRAPRTKCVSAQSGALFRNGTLRIEVDARVDKVDKPSVAELSVFLRDQEFSAPLVVGEESSYVFEFAVFAGRPPVREIGVRFKQRAVSMRSSFKGAREEALVELNQGESAGSASLVIEENLHKAQIDLRWKLSLDSTGPTAPPDFDVTPRFLARHAQLGSREDARTANRSAFEQLVGARLHNVRIMLIPGLFTKHYPTYFSANEKWLSALGLDVTVAPLNTEQTCAFNANHLHDLLQDVPSEYRVLFIAHSKGVNDVTELLRTFPDAEARCFGCIFLQGPVHGTFVSDWVQDNKLISSIAHSVTEQFGGTEESYKDLSFKAGLARRDYFLSEVAQRWLSRTVCVASYGSFRAAEMGKSDTVLAYVSMKTTASAILDSTGFCSDGLVAPNDARLPHTDLVYLDDLFHSGPGFKIPGTFILKQRVNFSVLFLKLDQCHAKNANIYETSDCSVPARFTILATLRRGPSYLDTSLFVHTVSSSLASRTPA
ncbi:hypothetical protein FVE85_8170 [Porphyridium purpureum]|uniref:Uncharacterized protein n=1 Tax=Porphyridium purpureum TaxID=35688 RepID=A0A5J4YPM4_PORPP|nr:hypothetical protein FVE85_8170 [Porphyridium purpureum]|eukprot:POR3958..scf295_9